MIRQTLLDSIDCLKDESFLCSPGFSFDLYLDPIKEAVYLFLGNNSIPEDAYHGIDLFVCKIYNKAIPGSVFAEISEIASDLNDLVTNWFQGRIWNGRNHQGLWKPGVDDYMLYLRDSINIAYYWEPDEFYEPLMSKLKQLHQEGKTADMIVDYIGTGDLLNGAVVRDDAIRWVQDQIDQWELDYAG